MELLIAPSVSLAGLLLVFIGHLLGRAKELMPSHSKPLRALALAGLAPIAVAFLCTAQCVIALTYGVQIVPAEILFLAALASTMSYAVLVLMLI